MSFKNKEKEKKTSYIFTRETMGMTLLLFCTIVMIMLLTGSAVFGPVGKSICTFMYGAFGYGSLFVVFMLAYLGEWLVFERKFKIPLKLALTISLTAVFAFFLFHAATTGKYDIAGYGGYIKDCYVNAANGWSGYTFGGAVSALAVYPLMKLSPIAAYVIFSVLTLAGAGLIYLSVRGKRVKAQVKNSAAEIEVKNTVPEPLKEAESYTAETYDTEFDRPTERPIQAVTEAEDNDKYSQKNLGRKILFENDEFAAESYRRNMIFNEDSYFNHPVRSDADYLSNFSSRKPESQKTYTQSFSEEVLEKPASETPYNYVYGDEVAEKQNVDTDGEYTSENYTRTNKSDYTYSIRNDGQADDFEKENDNFIDNYGVTAEADYVENEVTAPPAVEEIPVAETPKPAGENENSLYRLFGGESMRTPSRGERGLRSNANLFDDEGEEPDARETASRRRGTPDSVTPPQRETINPPRRETVDLPIRTTVRQSEPAVEKIAEDKPKHVWKKYVRPTLELLDDYPENNSVNTGEIEDNKRIICETLARFKIDSEVQDVVIGPAITRYDVKIIDKTKTSLCVKYCPAIAMELMKDNVNGYLNYTKGAFSIEVPNSKRSVVGLKGMLASREFINCKPTSLTFALGKDVDGGVKCPDITKMPHLLVAGTTGSGKSICLSALLVSLLYKYGPEDLRLILVDPKQVEFISYDKLPHLMINEIIYEVDKAIKALNWAIKEMERRYTLFKDMTEAGVATKNLDEYNAHLPAGEEKLPKIVVVLDEFGDLMLQAKKDIESRIIKLVQKARACGIHLILATQRPSVDCITGLIKSNLPTRIGFKVNSFDDARCIFDIGGAEKLLGKGDMYFRSAEAPDLARIQGCFIDTPEVQRVTDFIKAHNETYFDQSVSDFINTVEQEETAGSLGAEGGDITETKIDDTFLKALKYCVTNNQASVSMIQRRFPIGYIKAAKIMDWMTDMNYVTPNEGSKPRKVLLSKDEFLNIYGEIDD